MKWVRRRKEADVSNKDENSEVQNSKNPNWMAPVNNTGGQKIINQGNGVHVPNGVANQIANKVAGKSK